ncbi:MAG: diaminopimelate decarboxylase [Dehalococcoidia bacterium]|nr:diaminopimelate decarboxylase [Dehalococcoidia bacterium]
MNFLSFKDTVIFPKTAGINVAGHLSIGGCDLVDLADEFGTPLYIYDETTLIDKCREFLSEFQSRYPKVKVAYASKAFMTRGLAALLKRQGLGLDVVSGGEMSAAKSVDFPMEKVYFHGNNKGRDELLQAIEWGLGSIVVDNLHELRLLDELCQEKGVTQNILLRVSPGIDPHTHAYTTTGVIDSKFGLTIATGQAEDGVARAVKAKNLRLLGLHFHLGSPIFELEPYPAGIKVAVKFAAEMIERYGLKLEELNVGGGFAIQYVRQSPPPAVSEYAEAITTSLKNECERAGIEPPTLVVEPGRSLVGRAGVALYRVGFSKDIPDVRKYVSVDGGMADNIRPAIYGSLYEAVIANRPLAEGSEVVTIAGKYCESGDILIRDLELPPLNSGDLLALPASGAYNLAMSSNYNLSTRPAVVMVKDGAARLLRRRESYQDLIALDYL